MAALTWSNPDTNKEERLINFATLKAMHGARGVQPGLREHWEREAPEMATSGIPLVGACHRLLPDIPALIQVADFLDALNVIDGYEGRIIELDCEQGNPQAIRDWMVEWNHQTHGYPVMGYLPDWKESTWIGSDLSRYGFAGWWASEYVSGENLPALDLFSRITENHWHSHDGVSPTVLQFTSKALVPGVPGVCDVNAFRGTLTEFHSLTTKRQG